MAANPKIQLVVVGPVEDHDGKKAHERLHAVQVKFGADRIFFSDQYFSGGDKALLMAAADFILMPSR